jgi:pimeloyl-ACP methyl ester carboxylesterase
MRRHAVRASGGRTLAVIEDGDRDGVPVLYHHGTPGAGLLYRPWSTDAAERGIRLIGFDRAGYGGSDRQPGRTVADVAADAAAIADALEIDRFATWGASGGGPHALACAALLGGRVVAAATIAGAAPSDASDLDFMAGMGEDNIEEFEAAFVGEQSLRPLLEAMAAGMLGATAEQLVEQLRTLLSPPDAAVVTGDLAEFLLDSIGVGIGGGVEGWIDDDLAFVKPWGFDPATIAVPLQVWQGRQDLMVPVAHGEWLASHLPGAEARISAEDGHLTLTEVRLGEVYSWLAARF